MCPWPCSGFARLLFREGALPGSKAICHFRQQSRHWPGPSCWGERSTGTTSAGRREHGGLMRLLSAGWRLCRPPCPAVQSILSQEREKKSQSEKCETKTTFCNLGDFVFRILFFSSMYPESRYPTLSQSRRQNHSLLYLYSIRQGH